MTYLLHATILERDCVVAIIFLRNRSNFFNLVIDRQKRRDRTIMALIKHRRPNFNQDELRALIRGVEKRSSVIAVRIGPQMPSQLKREAWQQITDEVNSVSSLHEPRTLEEVQRRYRDYKHRSRKKVGSASYRSSPYEMNDSFGETSDASRFNAIGAEEMLDSPPEIKPVLHVINIQSNNTNALPSTSSSISPSKHSPERGSPRMEYRKDHGLRCENQTPAMEWMVNLQERLIIAVEQLVEDFCESSAKASADNQRIAAALEGILAQMQEKNKQKTVSEYSTV